MTYASREGSDKPVYLPCLTKVFAGRFVGSHEPKASSYEQDQIVRM